MVTFGSIISTGSGLEAKIGKGAAGRRGFIFQVFGVKCRLKFEDSSIFFYRELSSTQGLNTVFKQGQAFDEIHNDVIHSKCISKTNFMSGIDVYVYHWPYSNII